MPVYELMPVVMALGSEPGGSGGDMTTYLSTMSSIVTQVFTWVGSVGTAIMADPILTFSLGIFAVGSAVGIFGRLLSRG